MMSHFSGREKSLPNPGATFHLIKTLHSDWAVPTRLFTFNKRIGKSVINRKRPKTLYLSYYRFWYVNYSNLISLDLF